MRKLAADYDAGDRLAAMALTGLLYVDASAQDLHQHLNTVVEPLNRLDDAQLSPWP
jgi:2-oxoglutarate/2-oxoacid ferredoxin oxidoreductase subunit beta